jgi:hypothetical protein
MHTKFELENLKGRSHVGNMEVGRGLDKVK